MGGESSSSSIESNIHIPTGTEMELLRIAGVKLFLLDDEESIRMGTGHFALIMMVQDQTSLAALVAQVGDVQWPVGKDGPVLKLDNYRYTYAIPGLLYGVVFPEDTAKDALQDFESLMSKYCAYEVRSDIPEINNLRSPYPSSTSNGSEAGEARYWSSIAEDVEQYSNKLAKYITEGSSISPNGTSRGGEWTDWGGPIAKNKFMRTSAAGARSEGPDGMSPRMRHRVDQVRRMSAVAKLVSRTLLKGAINATSHVANTLGTAVGSSSSVSGYLSSDGRRELAVASIDAFAKVVEAVESAGKSLVGLGSGDQAQVQAQAQAQAGQLQEGLVTVGEMIRSMWTLNKFGIRMLWTATASSIFLNTPRNVNANVSSRSCSTSSETSSQGRSNSSGAGFSGLSSLTGQPSAARTISLSTPAPSQRQQVVDARPLSPATPENERELETAQLFPSSSALDPLQYRNYSASSPNHLYMSHQHSGPPRAPAVPPRAPAAFYHPAPQNATSPFQHYSRPPPTQVQLFPRHSGIEPSVSR